MKALALTLAIALLSLEANAAARRRAASAPVDPDAITIAFVPMEGTKTMTQTNLDLGTVAHRGERAPVTRVVQTVGIRVERKSGVTSGTATVRAYLQSDDGRSVIRVDGQPLTAATCIVDARAAIGATVPHRIEIEVPTSAAEGTLFSAIGWEVTTN